MAWHDVPELVVDNSDVLDRLTFVTARHPNAIWRDERVELVKVGVERHDTVLIAIYKHGHRHEFAFNSPYLKRNLEIIDDVRLALFNLVMRVDVDLSDKALR